MGFQVKPDTVTQYGDQVARNALNLSLVNIHCIHHIRLRNADGLWLQTLRTAHQETRDRMSKSLERGFRAMEGSGVELKKTAQYYAATDQQMATKLDTTYPDPARPAVDPPVSDPRVDGKYGPGLGHPGIDVRDPLRCMPIRDQQPPEFGDPMKLFNVVSDFLSPSWWMNQVLNDTIGCNPLEFATHHIIGDWEGFARCAIVWDDLGNACSAIGENVRYGLTWLNTDWQGHAADAAVVYFDQLRHALDSHHDVCHHLHDKYREVAQGVWNASRSIADLLKSILDNAIVVGIAVIAATFLSWTGVGAGISWAVGALECANIVRLWMDATGVISSTQTFLEGFVGFLQSQDAHVLQEIQPQPMPEVDYNHPNPQIGA